MNECRIWLLFLGTTRHEFVLYTIKSNTEQNCISCEWFSYFSCGFLTVWTYLYNSGRCYQSTTPWYLCNNNYCLTRGISVRCSRTSQKLLKNLNFKKRKSRSAKKGEGGGFFLGFCGLKHVLLSNLPFSNVINQRKTKFREIAAKTNSAVRLKFALCVLLGNDGHQGKSLPSPSLPPPFLKVWICAYTLRTIVIFKKKKKKIWVEIKWRQGRNNF